MRSSPGHPAGGDAAGPAGRGADHPAGGGAARPAGGGAAHAGGGGAAPGAPTSRLGSSLPRLAAPCRTLAAALPHAEVLDFRARHTATAFFPYEREKKSRAKQRDYLAGAADEQVQPPHASRPVLGGAVWQIPKCPSFLDLRCPSKMRHRCGAAAAPLRQLRRTMRGRADPRQPRPASALEAAGADPGRGGATALHHLLFRTVAT